MSVSSVLEILDINQVIFVLLFPGSRQNPGKTTPTNASSTPGSGYYKQRQ